MKIKTLLLALALTMTSGCGTLHENYVAADRKTLDFFGPKITKWIDGDSTLSKAKKKAYHIAKRSWGGRVEAGESDIKKAKKEKVAE